MESNKYQRLEHSPEEVVGFMEAGATISTPRKQRKQQPPLLIIHWAILAVVIVTAIGVLLIGNSIAHMECDCSDSRLQNPDQVYSPAQSAVQYKNLTFTPSLSPHLTKYQGPPTPENFKAWEDLYSFGISKIPMAEAAKLVNKTVPIPEYPGEYVVQLDVFHQLHCLNMIRLKVWATESPDYLDPELAATLMDMEHLDHCLDSMRQSFMCSADISVITWTWDEISQASRGHLNTLHTCKDFEAIRQWALEHQTKKFNQKVHAPDPLSD